MSFDNQLFTVWKREVDGKYIYRGMSRTLIADPLDPAFDPIANIRSELYELCDRINSWIAQGLDYDVVGSQCDTPLGTIIEWSRYDLDNPGLDFTSQISVAQGYAGNVQSSQIQQNFRRITKHLPAFMQEVSCDHLITSADQELLDKVEAWANAEHAEHEPVVLWVRRSCASFDQHFGLGMNPVGSFDTFRTNIQRVLDERELEETIDAVYSIIPKDDQEFCVRLQAPLLLEDVERIEAV